MLTCGAGCRKTDICEIILALVELFRYSYFNAANIQPRSYKMSKQANQPAQTTFRAEKGDYRGEWYGTEYDEKGCVIWVCVRSTKSAALAAVKKHEAR